MARVERRIASADYFGGFTLTEMAVVLVIVALLMGGMLMPLAAQREQRQASDTLKLMAEAVDALKGYAAANGRAPCPAPTPGAVESPAGGHCTVAAGYLPGPTLGVLTADAWGRSLRYAVATTYANAGAPPNCPSFGTYPTDAATTVNGLMLPMPCLVTDLRACGNATRYAYVISGTGACAAPFASIGDGLAVAIWSDGADTSTPTDDLTTWPALFSLTKVMTESGR